MKKLLILLYIVYFSFLSVLAQDDKTAIINPAYKKEIVNWCPSFEETELDEKLVKKYNCGAASKDYYTKKTI